MHSNKSGEEARKAHLLAELHRDLDKRASGYRDQALRILPHVCASCGREFSGKRLRELTVHHKDHNWKNNPVDGSNWELLCLYCHDHEHEKYKMGDYARGVADELKPPPSDFQPFAGLDDLIGS
ncbi:MAG: YajD family HNH nuclease [Kiritimatiellia bacterium]